MLRTAVMALALIAGAGQGGAAEIVGRATVIDGDTIEVRGERIRLWGIDAPEAGQPCTDATGETYRCGQQAAFALADWLGPRNITCEVRDTDRYGRKVAVCSDGETDLGAWLVERGWALDYRQYSKGAYAGQEQTAQQARAGIWGGTFTAPWDWRAGRDGLLVLAAAQSQDHSSAPAPSDSEIRQRLIAESVARYPGVCACPWNTMRNGRRCGGNSAYSRPGGYAPKCYPQDVSDEEVAAYRRGQR